MPSSSWWRRYAAFAAVAAATVLTGAPAALAGFSLTTTAAPSVSVTLSGSDQTASYTMDLTVDNSNPGSTAAGWNLTITSTQYSSGATPRTLPTTASSMTGVSAACTALGYRDTVLNTAGLVSYWRLGESSGTSAADAKGTDNGTYENGVTLGAAGALASDSDKSASFDGLDDRVSVADAASLRPAQISVEMWLKPGAAMELWDSPLIKTTLDAWNDGYGLYWSGGQIFFWVNDYTNAISAALPVDQWAYIVGAYDGSTLRLYNGGTQVASLASPGAITHSNNGLVIGAGTGASPYAWAGGIDEVALYNVVLSATQVQQHYDAAVGCTNPASTIAYPLLVPAGSPQPAPAKFFSTPAGTGLGTFTVTPTVVVSFPANAYVGSYSSTLELTLVSGP